jgi:diguanylate cyclase (GGDEF)-like protein
VIPVLDPPSLAVAGALAGLLLAAIVLLVHRSARRPPGTLSWFWAIVLGSIGIAIYANDALVGRFTMLVIGNLLINTSPTLLWRGARQFGGHSAPVWPIWATAIGTLAWSGWFGFVTPNQPERVLLFSTVISAWMFLTAREFWRLPERHEGPAVALTTIPLVLMGLATFSRVGQTLVFGAPITYAQEVPSTTLIYLVNSVVMLSGMVGVVLCITTRLTTQVRRLAYEDALTGALSRRGLYDLLPAWLSRHAGSATVTLLDMDYFKSVNDTLGHAAGDDLLRVLVRVLTKHVPGDGLVARMGGDEFVIVLPSQHASEPIARAVADEFVTAAAAALDLSEVHPRPSVSRGTAALNGKALEAFDGALRAADVALYAVKHGRGAPARVDALALGVQEQPGQKQTELAGHVNVAPHASHADRRSLR